jgi:hypothetical protein
MNSGFDPEDIKLMESLDDMTRQRLAFISERIRRGSFSPEEVRLRLMGLKVPARIVQAFVCATANRKPERQVYPHFNSGIIPTPKPKENYAIVVFSKEAEYIEDRKTGERTCLGHTCRGSWDSTKRFFVKSFSGKEMEFTNNEKEACKFYDDKICDACLAELIRKHHVYTIAIWDDGSECVHYPNEHWWRNGCLQPSFINRDGVGAFYEENIRFNGSKGWEEHIWEDREK